MGFKEPSWWYDPSTSWAMRLTAPAGLAYDRVAQHRFRNAVPSTAAHPVICVGNMTAGGTGKTPTSIAIAQSVRELGKNPWFLTRGFGGRDRGPTRVDRSTMAADRIGDEPRVLAAIAPTIVAKDRRSGAELIANQAGENAVIIMDDGLQNASLNKDLAIAVIDAKRGFGNGQVIPAGPLRASLDFQFSLCDAIIINGAPTDMIDPIVETALAFYAGNGAMCVLRAQTMVTQTGKVFAGKRVIAFAGIANPDRFFASLEAQQAKVVAKKIFPDHAHISQHAAREMLDAARVLDCQIATTRKDHERLALSTGARQQLFEKATVLDIEVVFGADDQQRLTNLITAKCQVPRTPRSSR